MNGCITHFWTRQFFSVFVLIHCAWFHEITVNKNEWNVGPHSIAKLVYNYSN